MAVGGGGGWIILGNEMGNIRPSREGRCSAEIDWERPFLLLAFDFDLDIEDCYQIESMAPVQWHLGIADGLRLFAQEK